VKVAVEPASTVSLTFATATGFERNCWCRPSKILGKAQFLSLDKQL
jgi:hypothetical protein